MVGTTTYRSSKMTIVIKTNPVSCFQSKYHQLGFKLNLSTNAKISVRNWNGGQNSFRFSLFQISRQIWISGNMFTISWFFMGVVWTCYPLVSCNNAIVVLCAFSCHFSLLWQQQPWLTVHMLRYDTVKLHTDTLLRVYWPSNQKVFSWAIAT